MAEVLALSPSAVDISDGGKNIPMPQFSTGHHNPVPRNHVLRVLRLFADVRELGNRWIEIRKWGVLLEQVYFQDPVITSVVLRYAGKLGIPPHLFWNPDTLDDYINNAPTGPYPQWNPRRDETDDDDEPDKK